MMVALGDSSLRGRYRATRVSQGETGLVGPAGIVSCFNVGHWFARKRSISAPATTTTTTLSPRARPRQRRRLSSLADESARFRNLVRKVERDSRSEIRPRIPQRFDDR